MKTQAPRPLPTQFISTSLLGPAVMGEHLALAPGRCVSGRSSAALSPLNLAEHVWGPLFLRGALPSTLQVH